MKADDGVLAREAKDISGRRRKEFLENIMYSFEYGQD